MEWQPTYNPPFSFHQWLILSLIEMNEWQEWNWAIKAIKQTIHLLHLCFICFIAAFNHSCIQSANCNFIPQMENKNYIHCCLWLVWRKPTYNPQQANSKLICLVCCCNRHTRKSRQWNKINHSICSCNLPFACFHWRRQFANVGKCKQMNGNIKQIASQPLIQFISSFHFIHSLNFALLAAME